MNFHFPAAGPGGVERDEKRKASQKKAKDLKSSDSEGISREQVFDLDWKRRAGSKYSSRPEKKDRRSSGTKDMSFEQVWDAGLYTLRNPGKANRMFDGLKQAGYRTELYEPFLETVAGVKRFGEAVPQGVSWNVLPTTFQEDIDHPSNKTMDIFGWKIDPWLEGGRLLGSIMSQQQTWKLAHKYVVPQVAKGLRKFIPNPTLLPSGASRASAPSGGFRIDPEGRAMKMLGKPKDVRRVGMMLGRNVPEGMIGGVAQAIREEDLDAALPAFVLWTSLGLLGDAVGQSIAKRLLAMKRKKLRGQGLDASDQETLTEAQRLAERVEVNPEVGLVTDPHGKIISSRHTNEGWQTLPPENRYNELPDGSLWRVQKSSDPIDVSVDPSDLKDMNFTMMTRAGARKLWDHISKGKPADQVHLGPEDYELLQSQGYDISPGVIRTQEDADKWAHSVKSSVGEGMEDVDLLRAAELSEAGRISQMRGHYYSELDVLPEHFVKREKGQVWTQGTMKSELDDVPVRFVDEIPSDRPGVVGKDDIERFAAKHGIPNSQAQEFLTGDMKKAWDMRNSWASKDDPYGVEIDPRNLQKAFRASRVLEEEAESIRKSIPSSPVAASFRNGEVLINRGLLQQKFIDKAWLKPQRPGVDPLPEDSFPTYADWERFVVQHEKLHAGPKITIGEQVEGAYENSINQKALRLSREFKSASETAGVLPSEERFLTYLSGADPGRQQARLMYRQTIDNLLMEVELKKVSAIEAAQEVSMKVREIASNREMFPNEEITQVMAAKADEMSLGLFEAVAGRRLTAQQATRIVEKAVEQGSSPVAVGRSLRGLTGGSENTVEALRHVDAAPESVKRLPLFNQENPNAVMPGGQAPARPDQLINIQSLLADVMQARKNLEPERWLKGKDGGIRLTLEEADEVIHNLESAKHIDIIKENDRVLDLIDPPKRKPGDPEPELRPEPEPVFDDLNPPHTAKSIAREKGGDKQAGFIFRHTGIGVINNALNGLSKNPLSRSLVRYAQSEWEIGQAWQEVQMRKMEEIVEILHPDADVGKTPARYFREYKRSMSGEPSGDQILEEKLHLLGQALDQGPNKAFQSDPSMMKAYQMARQQTDEIADYIGLAKGRRITNYLMHIFSGRSGGIRANQLADQMNATPEMRDGFETFVNGPRQAGPIKEQVKLMAQDMAEVDRRATQAPERLFGHLEPRSANYPGYEFNYLPVMQSYIKGANDYVTINKILKEGKEVLALIPESAREAAGIARNKHIYNLTNDYLKYIAGVPTSFRTSISNFFNNNPHFNRAVDTVIGYVGDGARGAKKMAAAQNADPEVRQEAIGFLDELVELNRTADRVTGRRKDTSFSQKIFSGNPLTSVRSGIGVGARKQRARTALKLDDIRRALGDKNIQAPVLSQIYRTMMIAKLGANMGFGLVNTTQSVSNGWPLLGTRYAASGVLNSLRRERTIHGRRSRDLLGEMGVLDDVTRVDENIQLRGNQGWVAKAQETVMLPGKYSEDFNRGAVALGEYERLMDGGALHGAAIRSSVEASEKANFVFNRTGTIPILRSPAARLFLMFQSYTISQVDFTAQLVQRGAKDVWKKGLISAAVEGDLDPLMKHMTAYLLFAGAGLPPIVKEMSDYFNVPDTNLRERAQHPIQSIGRELFTDRKGDFSTGPARRYGAMGLLGKGFTGPFVDSLSDIMQGQIEDAIYGMTIPSTFQRLYKKGGPTDAAELVNVLGLKKYRPPRRKRFRGGGGGVPKAASAAR